MELGLDGKRLGNEDLLDYFVAIRKFLNTKEGKFLYKILTDSKVSRVEDLIYSKNEDVLILKGELKAYSDIITLLSKENLDMRIKELINLIQN